MHYIVAILIWIIALVIAWPYVKRVKHADVKPVAAVLIFVTVFSVLAWISFSLLSFILQNVFGPQALTNPVAAAVFVLFVFVPPFLAARALIRRPPDKPPPLD